MIEILNAKLEDLAKQKEQLIANLNAVSGAEQVCRELLNDLQAKEKKPK